ncbi:MAG: preprotein translocase subunit SecG [Lentisphaerae bacterium]|nr:preprotein translocase subunit SecG [Lentisphaerota bacterium]
MNILYYVLCVVEVLVCLLLIGVILLQRSKDGGAAGLSMGGGMGEAIFGAQMGNVLTRVTVILGFIFLTNTLVLAVLSARKDSRSLMDGAVRQPPPAATLPSDFTGAASPEAMPVEIPDVTPSPAVPTPPAE